MSSNCARPNSTKFGTVTPFHYHTPCIIETQTEREREHLSTLPSCWCFSTMLPVYVVSITKSYSDVISQCFSLCRVQHKHFTMFQFMYCTTQSHTVTPFHNVSVYVVSNPQSHSDVISQCFSLCSVQPKVTP